MANVHSTSTYSLFRGRPSTLADWLALLSSSLVQYGRIQSSELTGCGYGWSFMLHVNMQVQYALKSVKANTNNSNRCMYTYTHT